MAVMGERLHRKCKVAIPYVDVGTDVFAFRDDREDVARILVKTATGLERLLGWEILAEKLIAARHGLPRQ
jgi:hypothetical protein